MARFTTVTWVCDFCATHVEDGRPDAWASVSIHPGPEHADVIERRHICPNCIERVLGVGKDDQAEWMADQ